MDSGRSFASSVKNESFGLNFANAYSFIVVKVIWGINQGVASTLRRGCIDKTRTNRIAWYLDIGVHWLLADDAYKRACRAMACRCEYSVDVQFLV